MERSSAFERQQFALYREATPVPTDASPRGDDPVTRKDDGQRVLPACLPDGPERLWTPDPTGQFGIADRLPIGDIGQGEPHTSLERCSLGVERKLKGRAFPGEVLIELGRRR